MNVTEGIYMLKILLFILFIINQAHAQDNNTGDDTGNSGGAAGNDSLGGSEPGDGTTSGNGGSGSNVNITYGEPLYKDEFKEPSAWLRICQPGAYTPEKYIGAVTTGKDECPAGYWFKDSIKVGCACGHGVWLFAKGWCDHTARIIVAHRGSCFNVNKDVRYIRQIGWYNSAFRPYHFVGTTGMEYIQTVPISMTLAETATNFHPEYHQHIGAIYRERGVESLTGRFCLSKEGNKSRPLAFKYFVPKLPYFEKRSCFAYANQDTGQMEYDAGYELKEGLTLTDEIFGPFSKPESWATVAENEKCATDCASAYHLNLTGDRNNTFDPEYIDPLIDEYFLEDLNEIGWRSDGNNSKPTEMPEQNCDHEKYVLSNKTMTELQEQTKRIIRLNIQSTIKNKLSPGVKYADYNLLQKSRTILDKVCPETELPETVLTGMLRMFRIAVNESFFHYPFHQHGDDDETVKIKTILDKCFEEARPMTFIYANETNGTGKSKASNESNKATCELGKFLGVNYEFKTNASSLNRTIFAKMPCSLWSNITELDMVVETAWKTVMFSHYYCARHFRENSLGFSIFEQKMERFFNRWIQHRWFYPGSALHGYKYIYQTFDLNRFAKALDRCVAAARSFSVYRKWIRRPTYSKHMGGKLFEEQNEIPDEIAGRTTLDAINPKLNQFNKKAYCLPFWHAPVSNPGINYNPSSDYKPGCVKYVKDEWETPFSPYQRRPGGWRSNVDII